MHCRGSRRMIDACQDEASEVDEYAKSSNISGRRLLIRAIRESLLSMELREASQLNKWTEEITKLRQASNVVINNEDTEQRRCVICHDREKSVILMPCRHLCLCIECSNNISVETCPKCRAIICSKIHVYTWVFQTIWNMTAINIKMIAGNSVLFYLLFSRNDSNIILTFFPYWISRMKLSNAR